MALKPYRIDVHHHILPEDYHQALAGLGIKHSGGRDLPVWNVENAIAVLDRLGIESAITSISAPGVYFGDSGFARDLARRCNEFSSQLVSNYPRRFGAFATLPLPDIDNALIELEYALDTLKMDGVVLLASIGNQYLGDPQFDNLFTELNRRKAVVHIHPSVPPGSDVPKLNLSPFLVEFIFDTTRAVVNLLYSGTLERCPDIRFIISHAGGAVPYLAWRISLGVAQPGLAEKVPQGPITYLKRLYYDTALSASPHALRSLQELVDPSHILFGSDYPFAPEPVGAATVAGLKNYDGFDENARADVDRESALDLFPRFNKNNNR